MLTQIKEQTEKAVKELIQAARLKPGMLMVIGCSSSEVGGQRIGTHSNLEIAQAVFEGAYSPLRENGIYLVAQCCEHLNRALIVEQEIVEKYRLEPVNVVPQPKAGGSFATTAYARFSSPVAVEKIAAHAGMDIGGTLIGMHLRPVAVPVRLTLDHIGDAILLCARTRPKFIGGSRAVYDEHLL